MRQPARPNPNKTPPTRTVQDPAPTKGWMSQENFAEADPQSAVILRNMFPEADAVRVRRGCVLYASGMTGIVETLLVYTSASASRLFAAAGANIYNITTGGAVGAPALTGLTNAYWAQAMFATPAGQFLVICNGADGVRTYEATAGWVNQTASITGTSGAVNTFADVTAHKKRLWFVPFNSTDLWYLPTESISGVAAKFPVGAQLKRGGAIMALDTWSVDAGDGLDDLFVAVSSEGELLIYAGTDPATSTTWSLVGVYNIGKPIGRRCLYRVGGDLLVVNEDGILPVSTAIKIDRAVAGQKSITAKIRQAYVLAVRRAAAVRGWEIVAHPLLNLALLNVPGSSSVPTQQFAFNTTTGSWGQYLGWDAATWAGFEDGIYFGAAGAVYRAEYGANDNGIPIRVEALPAFNHLGMRGRLKHVKLLRPYISTDIIDARPQFAVAIDYKVPGASSGSATASTDWFAWDVTAWDGPMVWYDTSIGTDWRGPANLGTVVSPYLRMDVDATAVGVEFEFRWIATDIVYEPGGIV